MQYAAFFQFVDGNIEVVAGVDRQAAEDGVAVVFFFINSILAVAGVVVQFVAEDVVMRRFGEIQQLLLALQVLALHFL